MKTHDSRHDGLRLVIKSVSSHVCNMLLSRMAFEVPVMVGRWGEVLYRCIYVFSQRFSESSIYFLMHEQYKQLHSDG